MINEKDKSIKVKKSELRQIIREELKNLSEKAWSVKNFKHDDVIVSLKTSEPSDEEKKHVKEVVENIQKTYPEVKKITIELVS